jgi:hypothetical protein
MVLLPRFGIIFSTSQKDSGIVEYVYFSEGIIEKGSSISDSRWLNIFFIGTIEGSYKY